MRPRLIAFFISLLVSGIARAERGGAVAEELFRLGREAMRAGDYKKACPQFAESQRLEPRVGTLMNLALCEEQLNQIVAARGHWQEAASLARAQEDDRVVTSLEHVAALDRRVPRLIIRVDAGNTRGVHVKRGDVDLKEGSLGIALPIDPGLHTIVASAPGYEDRAFSVSMGEGETKTIVVSPGPRLPELPPPSGTSPLKVGGLALGGIGALGVGAGIFFGLRAKSKLDDSNDPTVGACQGNNLCNAQGVLLRDDSLSAARLSTIFFAAGGVALASGAALFLFAPSGDGPKRTGRGVRPQVGPSGFTLAGQF